ncbi:xenotropic and polytropic retrovirus receptor 1 homolog [Amia ocellicauda]|uniref:xenotropic and polytropic retrovirus receptor 1 homolog n=1 Tax=Amia ocellicauda TaxID=2972642 RepID=UPI0034646F7E
MLPNDQQDGALSPSPQPGSVAEQETRTDARASVSVSGEEMKFAEHLASHVTPEWRKQYICYGTLKSALCAGEDGQPTEEDPTVLEWQHRSLQEAFFQMCDHELAKVNLFYSEKLAEVQRRLAAAKAEMESAREEQRRKTPGTKTRRFLRAYNKAGKHKTLQDLKLAFSELYLSLTLLQNYQELNYTGFCKIIKKHDKRFASVRGLAWRTDILDVSSFHTSKKIPQLVAEVESQMCELEGGDRERAMKRLRVPPLGAEQPAPAWTLFRVGVTCGLLLALLSLIGLRVLQAPDWSLLGSLLRFYRGGFLLIEFLFLLGVNIYGWKRAGVNHILIFELDPRKHLSHYHVLELAGTLAVCWCTSVLMCLHSPLAPIPLQLNPLIFYAFTLLLLLNPTSTCYPHARRWLLTLLCRVFTAPFHPVAFADFWLADQLNSLSPLFLDLWSLLCFYVFEVNWTDLEALNTPPAERLDCGQYSPGLTCAIQCFPPWLRFAQCLRRFWDSGNTGPHLLNAGKYSTVFIMVTFASLYSVATERPQLAPGVKPYLYLWAVATCISVLVTVSWDLRMDWGLLRGPSLLREETVYAQRAYYYCAMLADVLLRVSWAINIIFAQMRDSDAAIVVTSVLAPLEVIRRCVWNFFRLENEHLNNCGEFRAVRDVSVTPFSPGGHAALECIMDSEDTARDHGRKATRRTLFSITRLR